MEQRTELKLTIEKIVTEFSKQPWCKGRNPFTVLSCIVELASLRLLYGKHSISADPHTVASLLDIAALSSVVSNKKTGRVSIRRDDSYAPLVTYQDDQRLHKPLSIFDAEIRLNDIRRAMKSDGLKLPSSWSSIRSEHRRQGGRKRDPILLQIVIEVVQSLIKEKGRVPHVAVMQRLKNWKIEDSVQNARNLNIQGIAELYTDGKKLVAVDIYRVEHARVLSSLYRYTNEAKTHLNF